MNPPRTSALAHLLAILLLGVACASSANAQLTAKTLVYQGVTRTWYEHVPPSLNGSRRVPLVVALHGYNETGEQFAPVSEWMPKADAAGFIVVFPNGGLTVDQAFGWHVFVYDGKAPDDAGFLLAMIEQLKKDYPIDPSRIYMTGFSNGGGMTSTFAELHADVLAGAAPVSGGWRAAFGIHAPAIGPNAPVPVWIWRGTGEHIETGKLTPIEMDENQVRFWADFDGDKGKPEVYVDMPYTTKIYRGGKAEVRFTTIFGAEHSYQPGISEKIWDGFFSVFSRKGTAIMYHAPK
jgi:polyhydroxybutyrate depolymerase